MKQSIPYDPKKGGRPATGQSPMVGFRAPPSLLSELDAYATREGLKRSEAIRRFVEDGLKAARE